MQATSQTGTRRAPTASRLSFRTGDLDEARQVIGETYYATSIDVLDREHRLDAAFEVVRLGPLTLGDVRCGTDVHMRFGDLGAYHVDVPLSGELAWRQGSRPPATANARRAAVFHPRGESILERWNGDCRLLAVKIDAPDLLRHLEILLDRSVPTGMRLAPELDISRGPGLSWARLVALVVKEMDNEHGALAQPLMVARLQDALLTGLLLATEHRYREELDEPVGAALPGPVKRVVDAIHAHPERPFTTTELAGDRPSRRPLAPGGLPPPSGHVPDGVSARRPHDPRPHGAAPGRPRPTDRGRGCLPLGLHPPGPLRRQLPQTLR